MRTLAFLGFLALTLPLRASENPFAARLATALPAGAVELSLGVREFNRTQWMDSQGQVVNQGGLAWMPDADGVTKSVKGFQFDLCLLWQASEGHGFQFSLPYYNQEFSRLTASYALASPLDDSSVRRADASGDISLGWNGLLAGRRGGSARLNAGLRFSFPTGQGPYSSAHPMVATGLGGMAATASLGIEAGKGSWLSWLEARVPHEFGYSADIAPGAFVAYVQNQAPQTLAGGRAWVSRSPSYALAYGLGWSWYKNEKAAHRIAIELQLDQKGALRLDGAEIPNSSSMSFDVIPAASFSFAGGLALHFGWISPLGTAANRAVSNWGEYLVRVDYQL